MLAALAAFLLAALLTLSSVGKRVREIGTLKALGWTQRLVVRQIVGESVAQGVLGGLLGVVLGVDRRDRDRRVRADADRDLDRRAAARARSGSAQLTARTVTDQISLTAPLAPTVLLFGFLLAVVGGLIAGAAGAFRAARLRPADALRTVE